LGSEVKCFFTAPENWRLAAEGMQANVWGLARTGARRQFSGTQSGGFACEPDDLPYELGDLACEPDDLPCEPDGLPCEPDDLPCEPDGLPCEPYDLRV
jgi:hypothetical protein